MDDKLVSIIIDKFDKGSISELDFRDGDKQLILRKTASEQLPPLPRSEVSVPQEELPKQQVKGGIAITAPIVATFYANPGPDAPPFVKVGSKIKKGQVLCVLEAMKMMNNLEAEYDCEILEIKAKSGDLVEFGQTLFEVKKS
jgi:acetyl-CoA carboxylase biotin carboxyl carrier protein